MCFRLAAWRSTTSKRLVRAGCLKKQNGRTSVRPFAIAPRLFAARRITSSSSPSFSSSWPCVPPMLRSDCAFCRPDRAMSFALARDRAASKRRDGCVIASLASSPQKQSGRIFIQPLGRDPAWVSRKELQVNNWLRTQPALLLLRSLLLLLRLGHDIHP
jgi:hypothetical protein